MELRNCGHSLGRLVLSVVYGVMVYYSTELDAQRLPSSYQGNSNTLLAR